MGWSWISRTVLQFVQLFLIVNLFSCPKTPNSTTWLTLWTFFVAAKFFKKGIPQSMSLSPKTHKKTPPQKGFIGLTTT